MDKKQTPLTPEEERWVRALVTHFSDFNADQRCECGRFLDTVYSDTCSTCHMQIKLDSLESRRY